MPLLTRLRNTFRSGRVADDIDRELAFHLAKREDELVSEGLTRAEARRRFGNYTLQCQRSTLRGDAGGLTPADPLTLAAVVLVLTGAAAAAAYPPARRSGRLDPITMLRQA